MKLRNVALTLGIATMTALGLTSTASAAPMSGTEHFLLVSTDANANPQVSASGPITDLGTDQTVTNHRDIFMLSAGNLVVLHWTTATHDSFDNKTCIGRHTETGTYRIPRGTGAYQGTTGHGHYFLRVVAKGCNPNRPPTNFLLVLHASGPLHR